MYPHERSLVRTLADKPFTIIGVNSDKNLEEIRNVVKEKSITWRSFQNAGNEEKISTAWHISGWPTTFLIDKDGKIRHKNVRGDSLDQAIEELMAEMEYEVKLVDVDHESEDKAAMAAAKEGTDEPAADQPLP
jgi:peroxiredoxin